MERTGRHILGCAECGSKDVQMLDEMYHYTECGLPNVYLEGADYVECSSCGERSVTIPKINDLHVAIGEELVRKGTILSPGEIRFLRKSCQLTQEEAASILGTNRATLIRWERSTIEISGLNDVTIRMMWLGHWDEILSKEFQMGCYHMFLRTLSRLHGEAEDIHVDVQRKAA